MGHLHAADIEPVRLDFRLIPLIRTYFALIEDKGEIELMDTSAFGGTHVRNTLGSLQRFYQLKIRNKDREPNRIIRRLIKITLVVEAHRLLGQFWCA
jgi:hypothetical protein